MKNITIFITGVVLILGVSYLLTNNTKQSPNSKVPSPSNITTKTVENAISVPPSLARSFSNTDFSKADIKLEQAISGGPQKDGIPAIDQPKFIALSDFDRPDDIQAIVLTDKNVTKVYPYNILTWHEIVNDEIGDTPVAITFCPLCGSAIVYNRTLPDGTISTFGVSGYLLESNMIMYDRATENLWQQSTGKTLAGSSHEAQLKNEPFQLLTLGEVRQHHPDAVVLSENTGHVRDYARNPYAGYESNNQFVFEPSGIDTTFKSKTIMAVFRDNQSIFTAPWLKLREAGSATINTNDKTYTLTITDEGELTIIDSNNKEFPFYFEMWFSVSVQHTDTLTVINP